MTLAMSLFKSLYSGVFCFNSVTQIWYNASFC